MLTALPKDLLSSTALDADDLAFMQAAFDQVMTERGQVNDELRTAIASEILGAYMQGERDRPMLIERGRKVIG